VGSQVLANDARATASLRATSIPSREVSAVTVQLTSHDLHADEHATRADVALGYRLVHAHGLSDLTDGFVAGRIAKTQDFIFGGYGLLPEEARSSDLARVRPSPDPVHAGHGGIDVDAVRFVNTVTGARANVGGVIHAHPKAVIAFTATGAALLPISQWGVMFQNKVGFVPFDEDVTGPSSLALIAHHIGNGAEAIVLRHHGALTFGASVADAFFRLHRLELACDLQLRAMAAGLPLTGTSPDFTALWQNSYWTAGGLVENDGSREWPAYQARFKRLHPEYLD
jgi:ribulose-5-phosphate 4-epimerase/fuculose-1-phosphate aldolase